MPDGAVHYTRDGKFQVDSTGQVVTAGGFPLDPAITVPEGAQNVTIGTDGVVTVVDAQTGASTRNWQRSAC